MTISVDRYKDVRYHKARKGGDKMTKVPEYMKRAIAKYNRENTVVKSLRFNKKTDADLLDFFSRCPNVQGYIKEAVREKLAKERG